MYRSAVSVKPGVGQTLKKDLFNWKWNSIQCRYYLQIFAYRYSIRFDIAIQKTWDFLPPQKGPSAFLPKQYITLLIFSKRIQTV